MEGRWLRTPVYLDDYARFWFHEGTMSGPRAYVCEPGGLTPALLNRFAREAGAYVALDRPGLQLDMNGDFASVHCLRPGTYSFRMPYPCRVRNLKTGLPEEVSDGVVTLRLTAGETCRFRLFPAAR